MAAKKGEETDERAGERYKLQQRGGHVKTKRKEKKKAKKGK